MTEGARFWLKSGCVFFCVLRGSWTEAVHLSLYLGTLVPKQFPHGVDHGRLFQCDLVPIDRSHVFARILQKRRGLLVFINPPYEEDVPISIGRFNEEPEATTVTSGRSPARAEIRTLRGNPAGVLHEDQLRSLLAAWGAKHWCRKDEDVALVAGWAYPNRPIGLR